MVVKEQDVRSSKKEKEGELGLYEGAGAGATVSCV